jgi:hypothetical protein
MKYIIIPIFLVGLMAIGSLTLLPEKVDGQHHTMSRLFYKNGIDDTETQTSPYCSFNLANFGGSQWPSGNIDIATGDTLDLTVRLKTYCGNRNNYDDDDDEYDHFKTLVQSEFIWSQNGNHRNTVCVSTTIYNTDSPREGYFLEGSNDYVFTGLLEGDYVTFIWEINVNAYDKWGNRLMDSDVDQVTETIRIV